MTTEGTEVTEKAFQKPAVPHFLRGLRELRGKYPVGSCSVNTAEANSLFPTNPDPAQYHEDHAEGSLATEDTEVKETALPKHPFVPVLRGLCELRGKYPFGSCSVNSAEANSLLPTNRSPAQYHEDHAEGSLATKDTEVK